jgi:hypothetical protein
MAGLDPAIHVLIAQSKGSVDARVIPDQVGDGRPRMTHLAGGIIRPASPIAFHPSRELTRL